MSTACCIPIIECVYCIACARWVWKKYLCAAGRESEKWGLATAPEVEPVPRLCRYILSIYEDDLTNPIFAPPGGYGVNPHQIILKRTHQDSEGKVAPHMIYLDHENADIVVAIRGLTMGDGRDFCVLFDNKLGQTEFDGGYVHNGLLKAAQWVFDEDSRVLRFLLEKYPRYRLTFVGHSLGAGVVTLLTILAVKNRERLGNIQRRRIRCFAIAPARSISLNLAVRYADVINSVVLQDDFLPRTTVALENLVKSVCCFPCLMCLMCLKDTFTREEKMLKDPRRLYAPGRLYHIIVRKPFRFIAYDNLRGRVERKLSSLKIITPVVRTAVPVDGRFEHLVLSFNTTKDHGIRLIMHECQRALDVMLERESSMEIPPEQRMERQAREHREEHEAALRRAAALDVPQAYLPSAYGTFHEIEEGENSDRNQTPLESSNRRNSWQGFAAKKDDSGRGLPRKSY